MKALKEEIEKILAQDKEKALIFGDMIYKMRKNCGLCLMRSAEIMGIYFSRLRYFENNMFTRLPKKEEIDKIAHFYDLCPEFLWEKVVDFVGKKSYLSENVPGFKLNVSHRDHNDNLCKL